MDLLELMKTRRSVRAFTGRSIEKEKIEKLLEAAAWAPSAGNLQARDVVLIADEGTRGRIAEAAFSQGFMAEAPIVFVFCADSQKSGSRYGSRGSELYCILDTSASVQNLMLLAHSLGLGSCWVGAFDEERVRQLLGIPPASRPVAIVPVGYPAEEPVAPPRYLRVHNDKW